MNTAYRKDVRRTVAGHKKRFFSLLIITTLGVAMFTGLQASCRDLRLSADALFDSQKLFDIRVQSTLGLTGEDVAALAALDGVEQAEGGVSINADTPAQGGTGKVEMRTLSGAGLNEPYLLEGSLPAEPGQIAVTQKYLDDTGKTLGDTLTLIPEEDEEEEEEEEPAAETDEDWDIQVEDTGASEPALTRTEFTITGVVLDPMDVNSGGSASAFRVSSNTDYTFFVLPEDIESEIYTAIYLRLDDTADLNCYSDAYDDRVAEMVRQIEDEIQAQREQARYDQLQAEGQQTLDDARQEMNDKFAEADEEFADAQQELTDARTELDDGWAELNDARTELDDGWAQWQDGQTKLAENERTAEQGINDAAAQLEEGRRQLEEGGKTLDESQTQLDAARTETEQQLTDAQAQLDEGKAQAQQGLEQAQQGEAAIANAVAGMGMAAQWEPWKAAAVAAWTPVGEVTVQAESLQKQLDALPADDPQRAELQAQLDALNTQLAQATAAARSDAATAEARQAFKDNTGGLISEEMLNQLDTLAQGLGTAQGAVNGMDAQQAAFDEQAAAARAQLDEAQAKIDAGRAELAAGWKQFNDGMAQFEEQAADIRGQIAQGKTELQDSLTELQDGEADYADGLAELQDGETEYQDGVAEYEENKQDYDEARAEAEQKLADGEAELADLEMTHWYVQDRTSLSSYSSIQSDTASIEALGVMFPVIFFTVAVLISLTSVTRMVEEERGLIGTYKALGFGRGAIYGKYLTYAAAACVLGALLGEVGGYILMPLFMRYIFQEMYTIPRYLLGFDAAFGLGGPALFLAGMLGATALACRSELNQTPAALMRPKSPQAGSRVLLERFPKLWNRIRFLNKVTIRNLFRYKKRLTMTVFGIAGCTALMVCGLGLHDSVVAMMPLQYEQYYQYDLLVAGTGEDDPALLDRLAADEAVEAIQPVYMETVTLRGADGHEESVQLTVFPEGVSTEGWYGLVNGEGESLTLTDGQVILTRNAAELMGLTEGDSLTVRDMELREADTTIGALAENCLGNSVYMTEATYEELFEAYTPNAALARLKIDESEQRAFADELRREDGVASATSTQALKEDFSQNFAMMNAVVYLLTGLAAGLAFVVLFTLSTTNISERQRELATIKVLGFYDREVHAYVNKETLLLTLMGILVGLPFGRLLTGWLIGMLSLPAAQVPVVLNPTSYLLAAVASFVFALAVDLLTDRILDHIDMVEALKSVE
ncbi:hypothetical protein B5E65_08455 [Gemmiger sp. An120]|uniref:FtsX-like permease family protein n=1 Tax=Gemmiger sp. An120 TaxID=1965549 RepID=UPI000B37960A|nr:FtsX-like permease family protein [Gemmiger sp. An120]OUQ42359.1 hypothetical protein B5E65_08455 [Gemmiger sp. An120]